MAEPGRSVRSRACCPPMPNASSSGAAGSRHGQELRVGVLAGVARHGRLRALHPVELRTLSDRSGDDRAGLVVPALPRVGAAGVLLDAEVPVDAPGRLLGLLHAHRERLPGVRRQVPDREAVGLHEQHPRAVGRQAVRRQWRERVAARVGHWTQPVRQVDRQEPVVAEHAVALLACGEHRVDAVRRRRDRVLVGHREQVGQPRHGEHRESCVLLGRRRPPERRTTELAGERRTRSGRLRLSAGTVVVVALVVGRSVGTFVADGRSSSTATPPATTSTAAAEVPTTAIRRRRRTPSARAHARIARSSVSTSATRSSIRSRSRWVVMAPPRPRRVRAGRPARVPPRRAGAAPGGSGS